MRALGSKARRGRPRKERTASDRGTPEVQAYRRKLASGGDPAMTEYPLGMLRMRQLIDGDQLEAGCRYAFLYRQAVGRVQLSCDHLYRDLLAAPGGGTERPEEQQGRIEAQFRAAKRRLLAESRQICEATEDVAVFGRIPLIIRGGAAEVAARQLAAIRAGLDALVEFRHFPVDK